MNLVLRVGLGEPIEMIRDGCLLGTFTVLTKSGRSARVKISGRGLRGVDFRRDSSADDTPIDWQHAWPRGECTLIAGERLKVIDGPDGAGLLVDRGPDGLWLMTCRGNTPTPGRVLMNRDEVIALAEMLLDEAQHMERKRKHKETARVED